MKTLYDFILESLKESNAFIILKPEFLEYEQKWYDAIIENGWEIQDRIEIHLSLDQAKNLYKSLCDKPFFNDLCKYMSSGPCICAKCYKDCDNPIKEMKQIKYKFRDLYGKKKKKNVMHSSDSLKNVNREAKIIFG